MKKQKLQNLSSETGEDMEEEGILFATLDTNSIITFDTQEVKQLSASVLENSIITKSKKNEVAYKLGICVHEVTQEMEEDSFPQNIEDKIIQDEKDVVYNTYGDLHSQPELCINLGSLMNPDLSFEEKESEWHSYTPDDTIIKSLEENVPRKWIYKDGTKTIYTLSDFIDKMPHGIVDKKATGIGATTLEIKSERNSIIVLPTKILAYSKAQKHPETLYIGSKIKDAKYSTPKEIEKYLSDESIKYKKLLVVADSLNGLLNRHVELSSYFLMIDEIDILQSDSNYRPNLETVMDLYFKFSPKDRCLVTATMNDFSHPNLKFECKFDMNWRFQTKRNIRLINDKNIDGCIIEAIKNHPEEKIFIAYNSISHISNIIASLDENLKKECSILCSSQSKVEAGDYYSEELNDNKLPKRITFATCCYFTGIDIEDSYHLITISNIRKSYAALSLNRMNQIYGRCRSGYNILSDTIIYNSLAPIAPSVYYKTYSQHLIKKAHKVIELLDVANSIESEDTELVDLFSIIKEAIQNRTLEKSYGESIPLIRKNINTQYVPAYLNIDYLTEKNKMYSELYSNTENLREALQKQGHKVIFYSSNTEKTEKQGVAENTQKKEKEKALHESYKKICNKIRAETANGNLGYFLCHLGNGWNIQEKIILGRFKKIHQYTDSESVLKLLLGLKGKNLKAFKVLNNAVAFWALVNNHPFKKDITSSFKRGRKYSPKEIEAILEPIIKYHLHKKLSQRSHILFFNTVFATKRIKEKGGNKYTIVEYNPYGLKNHKDRIQKNENNLLRYFNL